MKKIKKFIFSPNKVTKVNLRIRIHGKTKDYFMTPKKIQLCLIALT